MLSGSCRNIVWIPVDIAKEKVQKCLGFSIDVVVNGYSFLASVLLQSDSANTSM